MLSNLTPAQEPALWGGLATAVLALIVVFLPRFGITLTNDEQTALSAVLIAAIPIVVAIFVRQNVTPVAPPPAPKP